MKKLLLLLIFSFAIGPTFAQVGIGTTAPHSSAALDITSTNSGLLIPRMTSSQRNAIISPMQGLMVFQTDNSEGFYFYDGSSWVQINEGPKWLQTGNDIYNVNTGNVGIGVVGPVTKLQVMANAGGKAALYVENTEINAADTYGIHAKTSGGSDIGSAGIFGESIVGGANEIGVKGAYNFNGAAIAGMGWSTDESDMPRTGGTGNPLKDMGVYGGVDLETGIGVYGLNKKLTGNAAYFEGSTHATGTKSASVPTTEGNQSLYVIESPEIWFEDFGRGTLVNGQAHIRFDDMFIQTIFVDDTHPFHVFLQEQGESNGLYFLPDPDGKGFIVKEKRGGTSNIAFSYRITAKRRFYQDHRFGIDLIQPLENNLIKAKNVPLPPVDIAAGRKIIKEIEAQKRARQAQKEKEGEHNRQLLEGEQNPQPQAKTTKELQVVNLNSKVRARKTQKSAEIAP